ncbi:MAG TPA: response regulator [Sediminibacterium sp.]
MALLRVLLLEDSLFDAELLQRLLKKEIPEAVVAVVNNKNGFLAALQEVPDIILSDNSLPDINTREALSISRKLYPFVPFIMVSGTVGEEAATEIIRLGADDYILKDRLARLPVAIDNAILSRQQVKEKHDALDLLRANEEKYRSLVDRVSDAFISLDNNFRYTFLNGKAAELIRRDPLTLIGKNVWEEFPEAIGSETYHSMHMAMSEQKYVFNEDYFEPLDLWQENHIYPSPDGLSIFIRDVTEQRRAQRAVKRMEQEVLENKIQSQKQVTRAIIHAQENERNRLGREMHDNVNQILTACKIYLTRGRGDVPEEIRYPLELVDKAISEIRMLSKHYVAPLKDIDLREMIQDLLHELEKSGAFTTSLAYRMEGKEPEDDLKLNIYRIVQEQLNNIVKHAAARRIDMTIHGDTREMRIVISDDGAGFDVAAKRKGIGISNMINRVETFNGSLHINSSPGNGCTLAINLPLV